MTRTEMGTFAIDPATWLRVTTAAQKAKISRSEFIRRALADVLDRPRRDRKKGS